MRAYDLPHMGGSTLSTRLMSRILKEIRVGEFCQTDRLPSELELASRYGVSRSVVRDVLSDLEREGFIQRGRGIGTLIHRSVVNMTNRLDVKFEYNELIQGAGYQPGSDSIRLYERAADETLAECLEVDCGEPVLVCEKRILASGKPAILSTDHLPLRLFEDVNVRELDWATPVFDLLETHCGIAVDSDVAQVSAVIGPPQVRQKLEVQPDQALLFVDEVGYYKLSRPILHSLVYYTDFCAFTILRKRI